MALRNPKRIGVAVCHHPDRGSSAAARCCLLALATAVAALAQQQVPAQYASQIARLKAYDAFFFRVTWLQNKSSQLSSQGKSTAFADSVVQVEYGLTDAEQAQLASIAADCRAKSGAIQDQARPLLAAGQSSASSPTVQALLAALLGVTSDHIDQLQAALGPMRFAALDALVTKTAAVSPPPGATGAPDRAKGVRRIQ